MARPLRLLAAALVGASLVPSGCGNSRAAGDGNVLVHVDSVAVDAHDVPVLVLQENDGTRWLPIWIGTAEARSIALEMEERSSPRPNTHDLARNVIYGLDGEVEHVTVTELKRGTYYATLALRARDRTIEIDARPSDAIAIALRTRAPIYVRETLFDAAQAEREGDRPRASEEIEGGREI